MPPSLEGLQKAFNLTSAIAKHQTDMADRRSRKDGAMAAMEAYQSGDIKGAISALGESDPDAALSLMQNLRNLDSEHAESISEGTETGGLEASTRFGSNPRQLAEFNAQAQKELAQINADVRAQAKEESRANIVADRNDRWATEVWRTVTNSQPFKNYQDYKTKQSTLINAATNPSAYGDIAAVFGFMKTLDPQSVVRESEYATAKEAGSLLTTAKNYLSKAEKGEILQPAQRADLVRLSKHLGSVYKQNYDEYLRPVYQQATKRGVDIELIDPYNLDEKGRPTLKQEAPQMSQEDQQALDWAKKNPNDPRAKQILQLLGQ